MKKNRHLQIMNILLEDRAYIPAKKIATKLKVSVRTIYNDLESVEFKSCLHGAFVEKKPNIGIRLNAQKEQIHLIQFELETLQQMNVQNSDFDDVHKIILLLLSEETPILVDNIAQKLYKTKNSITLLLDQVEEFVGQYHLVLYRKPNYGIYLMGDESKMRILFRYICQINQINRSEVKSLSSRMSVAFSTMLCEVFSLDMIHKVEAIVELSQTHLNTTYTDYDFGILVLKLCIVVRRVQLGFSITTYYSMNQNLQEYFVATFMKMETAKVFHIQLSLGDHQELAEAILATRKTINVMTLQQSFNEDVIDTFMSKISERLDFPMESDMELKFNLINHLKPAIRRMKYGAPNENPLLNRIRYDFTFVYIAVMTTIDEIENQENIYFDANELSYICLHIVAALNRKKNHRSVHSLLISNDGLTLNAYLKSTLESQFSELLVTIASSSTCYNSDEIRKYALILNTTCQPISHPNVISIRTLIEQHDFDEIRHWLFTRELEKTILMKHQLKDYILMFHDDPLEKYDLLKKYCNYLVENKYVTTDFYDSVIQRENRSTTSIGRGVAVPHGSKETVLKPVILIVHTKEEIAWDELNVDMIFITALNATSSTKYSYFFKQVFHVVSDEKSLNMLKNSTNMNDIERLLFPEVE